MQSRQTIFGKLYVDIRKCLLFSACGSSADIKSQDMFNLGAPFFRRCFHCGMVRAESHSRWCPLFIAALLQYMQFLGSVYFTAKTGKKRNKVRSCVNQVPFSIDCCRDFHQFPLL